MEQQENNDMIDIEQKEVKTDTLFDENRPPESAKEALKISTWDRYKTLSILTVIIALCCLAFAVGYQNGYVAALDTCEICNSSMFAF